MGHERRKQSDLIEAIIEIINYRYLLRVMIMRSLKIRYKQTFLGSGWVVVPAVLTMLVFTFVNKTKILTIDTGSCPYPVFAFCGIIPWTFFATSLTHATLSLVNYASLLGKTYFPREVIPLSVILSHAVGYFISLLLLFVMMLIYRLDFPITILALPVIFIIQCMFTVGIAFFFSMGHLFYRDVGYIVKTILPLLMFVSPVIYPLRVSSAGLQNIIELLNPMIPIINAYRELLLYGTIPRLDTFAMPLCLCFSMFIIGLLWFHNTEHLFAENV